MIGNLWWHNYLHIITRTLLFFGNVCLHLFKYPLLQHRRRQLFWLAHTMWTRTWLGLKWKYWTIYQLQKHEKEILCMCVLNCMGVCGRAKCTISKCRYRYFNVMVISSNSQVYHAEREKESRHLIEDITVEKSTCTYSICLALRSPEPGYDSAQLLEHSLFPISGFAARSNAALRRSGYICHL